MKGKLALAQGTDPRERRSYAKVNVGVPIKAMKAGVISEKMFGLRGSPNDVGPGPGQSDSTFFVKYARENVVKFVQ